MSSFNTIINYLTDKFFWTTETNFCPLEINSMLKGNLSQLKLFSSYIV